MGEELGEALALLEALGELVSVTPPMVMEVGIFQAEVRVPAFGGLPPPLP